MENLKVLLVEDEVDILDMLKDYFEFNGFNNVLTTTKGREAIEIINLEKPDVVFLDIQLADEVSGMEVLKQVKSSFPNTKFIIISGYKDEYEEEANSFGAYKFITKPIKIEDIKCIIKDAANG
ncbi:MAG: response regulator [Candidatus Zapsychrus exili]|nr:response regulator [Candidatus Zapsychrus exili]